MAFSTIGTLGSTNEKTSDSSLTLTVSATAEAGNLVIVVCSLDNVGTTDAETTQLSLADSAGNTWTKVREQTESSGAANDGVTLSVWYSVLTSQLASGSGTITVTSSSDVTAKVIEAYEFSLGSSSVALGDGTSLAVGQAASGQPGALNVSGMTSREYLLIDVIGIERGTTTTLTPQSGYTEFMNSGTSGGVTAENQSLLASYRIATLTTDTSDPAIGTGVQHVHMLFALYETGGGGTNLSPAGQTRTRAIGTASLVPEQLLRPVSDSVDGSWTDQSSGTVLYAAIDDDPLSDTDYIRSELTPSNSGCRVKIASGSDPALSTGHKIVWRVAKSANDGTINMTVTLRQGGGNSLGGGTQIASFTRNNVSTTLTTYEETLSGVQADSITDYTDLYLEFYANQV